ncbi:MAG: aminodeoxychorismate synthase component I [Deltaproteobacteria bacterium]
MTSSLPELLDARYLHRLVEPVECVGARDLAFSWRDADHLVVLESTDPSHPLARHHVVAKAPAWRIVGRRNRYEEGPPGRSTVVHGSPLDRLARLTERFARIEANGDTRGLPFTGGLVGYIGYEVLYAIEDVPDLGRDDRPAPDLDLGLFLDAVVFDAREAYVVANGFGTTPEAAEDDALLRRAALVAELPASASTRPPINVDRRRLDERRLLDAHVAPVLSRDAYVCVVETVKDHIRAGDAFEVCTSNRFEVAQRRDPLELYDALATISPAPFSALLKLPERAVVSSSPERFLALDTDGRVESRPIKGTRPRGATAAEDEALRDALANSEKDRAENIMIVDLVRNDLGRVCAFGTIGVDDLQAIESFAFTHQMVSTVHGRLREGLGVVDVLRAAFPAGSMTGAPKIEAMKIIDRLEPTKRGIFSGTIGYIGFDGAADLSIVIRTMIVEDGRIHFHTGGAIVADSNAEEEYQETLDKAAALLAAIEAT